MKPLGILKGSCTVIGAATLATIVGMVAIHTIASLELPHIKLNRKGR